MQVSTTISIAALLIAAGSACLAMLSYRRDASRVCAWSEIHWYWNGHKKVPAMRIRIVNTGRRPVSLMNLVLQDGKERWSQPLCPGPVPESLKSDFLKHIYEVQRTLSQGTSIKLSETEAYQMEFGADDYHEFIGTHREVPLFATQLFVEDVNGTRYAVQGAAQSLLRLCSAWTAATESRSNTLSCCTIPVVSG